MLRKQRWLVTAVVVGGAGYFAGRIVQQIRDEEAGEYARITGYAPAGDGLAETSIERLRELGQLHAQGILDDDEFVTAKTKLLSGD